MEARASETGFHFPNRYDSLFSSWHCECVCFNPVNIYHCLRETGLWSAHLPSYLHFKSAASCWVHVLLLKMHEQSVQERLSGRRCAACLKNSWKKWLLFIAPSLVDTQKERCWPGTGHLWPLYKNTDMWEHKRLIVIHWFTHLPVFFQTESSGTRSKSEVFYVDI